MEYLTGILLVLWLYVLSILKRGKIGFWHFLLGSGGLFIFLIIIVEPLLTIPLTKAVTIVSGGIGNFLNIFKGYYEYSIIFIHAKSDTLSLIVDYECAGIIEMTAFVSLLVFFPVYTKMEKVGISIFGVLYIFIANVIRLVVICCIIYFFGTKVYFVAHTIVGRIIFYGLSMVLYYTVFTKAQIIRQKVGNFKYED